MREGLGRATREGGFPTIARVGRLPEMHEVDEARLEHRLAVVVGIGGEVLEAPGVSIVDAAPGTPMHPG